MATYVVGVKDVDGTAVLCDYLTAAGRLGEGDVVEAVNSHVGGDETSAEAIRDGEDALNLVRSRLSVTGAQIETHQFVRGQRAHDDILAHADDVDADELVIGVRKRNPTSKVVFGSTTQRILLTSNRPVRVIPLLEV
jgi:nucleotide-binding universal stress UspA family protein